MALKFPSASGLIGLMMTPCAQSNSKVVFSLLITIETWRSTPHLRRAGRVVGLCRAELEAPTDSSADQSVRHANSFHIRARLPPSEVELSDELCAESSCRKYFRPRNGKRLRLAGSFGVEEICCKIFFDTLRFVGLRVVRSYEAFPPVPHVEYNNSGYTCVHKHTWLITGREADRQ